MASMLEVDAHEISPYGLDPEDTDPAHRLVVIPDASQIFNLLCNAEISKRVREILDYTDWDIPGRLRVAPVGGLLIGLPGVRTYNDATDEVLHALQMLRWYSTSNDYHLSLLAHNLRRDQTEPLPLCGEATPIKGARADVVYDAPYREGEPFNTLMVVAALRAFNVGFNGESITESLDHDKTTLASFKPAVSQVIVVNGDFGDIRFRQWQLTLRESAATAGRR